MNQIKRLWAWLTSPVKPYCPHRDDGTMCDDCANWWAGK